MTKMQLVIKLCRSPAGTWHWLVVCSERFVALLWPESVAWKPWPQDEVVATPPVLTVSDVVGDTSLTVWHAGKVVCSFVRYCGQGSSIRCMPTLRPFI